jgi:hypothetical protein
MIPEGCFSRQTTIRSGKSFQNKSLESRRGLLLLRLGFLIHQASLHFFRYFFCSILSSWFLHYGFLPFAKYLCGICGYTLEGDPVQVKQSDDVGRNVVDNFETATRRRNAKKGLIVAFSFDKGASREIARAKLHDNKEIKE